jgi:hypothetical protein
MSSHQINVAEYPSWKLRGRANQFSKLSIGSIDEPDQLQQQAKSLWLTLPTRKTIEAKALKEEDIIGLAEHKSEGEEREREFTIYNDFEGEYSFWFSEGALCYAQISSKAAGFSASRDGRMLHLPVGKSEMVQEFGEPRWRKETVNPP